MVYYYCRIKTIKIEDGKYLDKVLGVAYSKLFNCKRILNKAMLLLMKEGIELNYSNYYFCFATRVEPYKIKWRYD